MEGGEASRPPESCCSLPWPMPSPQPRRARRRRRPRAPPTPRQERPRKIANARRRFQEGQQAYDDGDFETALRHFQAAYELADVRARVFLLLNIAQAYDRLDRTSEAISHYEQSLRLSPDGPGAGVARGRLHVLRRRAKGASEEDGAGEEASSRQEAPPAAADPLAPAPPSPSEGAAQEEHGGSWWPWALGGALAVGGILVAVVVLSGGEDDEPLPTGGPVQFDLEALR